MTATFDHRDGGTPETAWTNDTQLSHLPPARPPARGAHLVVLAANPDDETLGAGGLIAIAATGGVTIDVIVATDGENSHPDSPTHTQDQLARQRRDEATAAIARLDPHATVTFLGLPDGGLRQCRADIEEALAKRLQPDCFVVTPWRGDRHPDHEACALAARALLRRRPDCQHWQYPIWAWHWADPAGDELPGARYVASTSPMATG
jgi:LmbE family N-acetylglucosaminyl deacetylase